MGVGWRGYLLGLLLFLALCSLSRVPLGWMLGAVLAMLLGGMTEQRLRQMRYQAEHDALTGVNPERSPGPLPLSISVGVATLPGVGGSPGDLMRRAENAHRVARQRKNAVCLLS